MAAKRLIIFANAKCDSLEQGCFLVAIATSGDDREVNIHCQPLLEKRRDLYHFA